MFLNKQIGTIKELMEPLMYSVICTMVQKGTLDETVIKGREEKLKWAK